MHEVIDLCLLNLDPTILILASPKVMSLAAIYTDYLIYRQKPIYGIKPLKVAIEKT